MANRRSLLFFSVVTIYVLALPKNINAASCESFVGKWAWFIGGEVTVNPDGTFVQESGNAGIWECTGPAEGTLMMRWRDGGFVNSLVLSPDGQSLSSTDLSQSYVTAKRTAGAVRTPTIGTGDPCRDEYAREVDQIDVEFEQKLAKCHHLGNAACLSEAVSTKASQLKAAGERLRLCNAGFGREAPRPEPGPSGPTPAPTIPPAGNDEFHSSEQTGDCCPTQECQAERYRELERQRYEFAKRCVDNRTSPCNVQPELIIPPLCAASKSGDQKTTGGKAIGQATTPPEPEPPGPFTLGAEENVAIKSPTLPELWEEWAKDYNEQVRAFLGSFAKGIPDDGTDYMYWSEILVLPDGTMQVADPGGRFVPTRNNPFAQGTYERNLTRFKNELQAQVHPRPFPPGSKLPWWKYTVSYKRSDASTPFTPAPTPLEPKPAPPKTRRTARQ